MINLDINSDPLVVDKMSSYSDEIKIKLIYLRSLVIESASEIDHIETLEETLKWGEPSFLVKKGSTIRIDWKEKKPNQYAMYFKCTSKLIPTFKEVYGNEFKYENNRAILFSMEDTIPKEKLKVCIKMALQYHKLKHLPLLGYKG